MLKGLVALVTGSASGLGKASVANFLKQGACVVGVDIEHKEDFILNPKECSETENSSILEGVNQDLCILLNGNICSTSDIEKALQTIQEKWGKLDVVLNCAATAGMLLSYNFGSGRMHEQQMFDDIVKTNIIGTFNVVRLSSAVMAKNKPDSNKSRGVIINTSSMAAFDGYNGQSAYSSSMAGIAHMTLPISRDLGPLGIRVATIAPGFFDTPMVGNPPELVIKTVAGLNAFPHRFGQGDEFTHCVETIIKNPMINGEIIKLNAGLRMPHVS